LAILLALTTSAFADSYPKITYTGGHPDIQTEKLKGQLNVLSDHVEFTTEGSQAGLKISYDSVEKVSQIHVVGGRPYLKTTAWVAGLVLAPLTFGGSLVPALGMTGLKKNGYYVTVEYKDEVALSHAVNFQVNSPAEQLKIKGDIENQVYKYRKALQEAKQKEITASGNPSDSQSIADPKAEAANPAPAAGVVSDQTVKTESTLQSASKPASETAKK
jgi:hypothetical protein